MFTPLIAALMVQAMTAGTEVRCETCGPERGPCRVVRLTVAEATSAAAEIAAGNEARLARLDALSRSGAPGSGTRSRRHDAHVLARLGLANLYRYLFRFAAAEGVVYEADAATLDQVFRGFSEPGLFPLARLERVHMGHGAVCVHYDLRATGRGTTWLGGLELPYRVEDREVMGVRRRVLALEWPSSSVGRTEILLAERHSFRVTHLRSAGPPGPYEAFIASDVTGAWIDRWGVHRPEAYMFWTTPLEPLGAGVPAVPLVGVRVWVPGLKLRLPWVLPDVDFEDLRELDLPLPMLRVDYLRERRQPAWMAGREWRLLPEWEGIGPVPPLLRERFPNR